MTKSNVSDFEKLNVDYSNNDISLADFLKQLPDDRQRFFMFGVPTYNNLGDLAIAHAEKRFFEKYLPEFLYIEITEPQTDKAIEELLPLLQDDDIIGYSGGGNIGSVYLNHERARRKVFSTFINHKTISFPQSVNFLDTPEGQKELKLSQEAYNKNPNLTIVARESKSLAKFQQYFKAKVLFTSDIVLSLNPELADVKRDGVLFILREDSEKVTDDQLIDQLSKRIEKAGTEVDQTDTTMPEYADDGEEETGKRTVNLVERRDLIHDKLKEIKSSQVVVTDRLHGMVFAVITKTPVLVFDNSYGKASFSYYNWLRELNYVDHTKETDPNKILTILKRLSEVKEKDDYDLTHTFDDLVDLIKNKDVQ